MFHCQIKIFLEKTYCVIKNKFMHVSQLPQMNTFIHHEESKYRGSTKEKARKNNENKRR